VPEREAGTVSGVSCPPYDPPVPITVVPTAYGRNASQALRDAVARAKRSDVLAPVTVVVPTNSVGVSARRRLASGELGAVSSAGRGVVGVNFLTVYRLAELLGAAELAAAGRRVLDVGCGKGRFARVFQEQEPRAELWGLDISEEMLRYVPAGIHTHAGAMTELPFEDGFFDGAYATESLEHAVEIAKAVSEICRVVKPGGRIAIIDKNAEHWGRLHTPEWEKWFTRKELERLLRRDCREVSSRFVSYWEDVEPDGLFLAWLAVK